MDSIRSVGVAMVTYNPDPHIALAHPYIIILKCESFTLQYMYGRASTIERLRARVA